MLLHSTNSPDHGMMPALRGLLIRHKTKFSIGECKRENLSL